MKKNLLVLIVIIVISSPVYTDTFSGLIAHYKLDGNADDSSSNQYNATAYNSIATTVDRFGNAGGAYLFDGVNNYISTPLYRENYAYFTVAAWFKYTGLITDYYRAIVGSNSTGFGATSQYFFMGKNSGNSNIGVQDQTNYYNNSMAVGTNAWDGEWHHIVYAYNNGTGQIYLDNVAYGSASFVKGSGQLYIGLEAERDGYYFKGALDDVMFFNQALSTSEIAAVYSYTDIPEPSALIMSGLVFIFFYIKKIFRF